MKRIAWISALMILVLFSCGPAKIGTSEENLSNLSTKKIIKNYDKAAPQFETINARLSGLYNDGYMEQSVNLSMRMKAGDTIWISAKKFGIPLAKMLITPDRVQFYEKLTRQYFDGDFGLLSKWLGMNVDFEKVQNLLLGRATEDLNNGAFKLQSSANGYIFSLNQLPDLQQSFLVDKQNFRLKGQQLKRDNPNQAVTVEYPGYHEKGDFVYPKSINIVANQRDDHNKIKIDYKSLEVDQRVSFPFEMPSGYKEIKL